MNLSNLPIRLRASNGVIWGLVLVEQGESWSLRVRYILDGKACWRVLWSGAELPTDDAEWNQARVKLLELMAANSMDDDTAAAIAVLLGEPALVKWSDDIIVRLLEHPTDEVRSAVIERVRELRSLAQ